MSPAGVRVSSLVRAAVRPSVLKPALRSRTAMEALFSPQSPGRTIAVSGMRRQCGASTLTGVFGAIAQAAQPGSVALMDLDRERSSLSWKVPRETRVSLREFADALRTRTSPVSRGEVPVVVPDPEDSTSLILDVLSWAKVRYGLMFVDAPSAQSHDMVASAADFDHVVLVTPDLGDDTLQQLWSPEAQKGPGVTRVRVDTKPAATDPHAGSGAGHRIPFDPDFMLGGASLGDGFGAVKETTRFAVVEALGAALAATPSSGERGWWAGELPPILRRRGEVHDS